MEPFSIQPHLLSEKEKKELLGIARKTLEATLAHQPLSPWNTQFPRLKEKRGLFVTLEKREHGLKRLRGCIGRITAEAPLFSTVQEMTIQAASHDPRFPPLRSEELACIEIEISILSPLVPLQDPNELCVGEHGLVVRRGNLRGLLLPQVAEREKWSREEFLGQTCLKAGLSFDSWRSPDVEIQVFTAQVFGES